MRGGAVAGRSERALVAAVFVVSLALRAAAIDRPLDFDEGLWVQRGATFVDAVLRRDAAGTYLRPHPGVTTMWLVGGSNAAWCSADARRTPSASWRECLRRLAREPYAPLTAYIVPRLALALVTSAAMAALVAVSIRLLGLGAALLAAALVTFEPFFLAHQRFITTDGLAADLAGLAVLLFLLHLRERGGRWLVLSGLAFGLAVATKLPALLMLVPMLAWVAAVERGVWPGFAAQGLRRRARELATWAAVAALAVVLLWPALWVRPVITAGRLRADLGLETVAYPSRMDDPRWDFYARVVAWRLSPLLQAGALLGVVALVWPPWRRALARRAEIEATAALVVLTVVLLRLAGGAAVERYLLPVVPPMALVAGAGWTQLGDRLASRLRRRGAAPLLGGAVVAGQIALLVPHLPGGMTFYNPLLGGAPAARKVLAIGMGEGLDRAAAWLNDQPGAEALVVASGYSTAFAPYFKGRSLDLTFGRPQSRSLEADRIVLYVRQVQGGSLDPVLMAYLESQPPLHVVRLHGVDYAWIYRGPIVLPEGWRTLAVPEP